MLLNCQMQPQQPWLQGSGRRRYFCTWRASVAAFALVLILLVRTIHSITRLPALEEMRSMKRCCSATHMHSCTSSKLCPKVRFSLHHTSHAWANHRPQQICLHCLALPALSLKWDGSGSCRAAPCFPKFHWVVIALHLGPLPAPPALQCWAGGAVPTVPPAPSLGRNIKPTQAAVSSRSPPTWSCGLS